MSNQGQKCNRTACNNQDAQWYNHSTRAFYCEACAVSLNKIHKVEAHKLYGHDLCTLSPQDGDLCVVITDKAVVSQGECDVIIDTGDRGQTVMIPGNAIEAFLEKLNKLDLKQIAKHYHEIHK